MCSAGSRLLVQETCADTLVSKLKERMKHLRLGNSLDKTIDMGAIVDPSQKKSVAALVDEARKDGAEASAVVNNRDSTLISAKSSSSDVTLFHAVPAWISLLICMFGVLCRCFRATLVCRQKAAIILQHSSPMYSQFPRLLSRR